MTDPHKPEWPARTETRDAWEEREFWEWLRSWYLAQTGSMKAYEEFAILRAAFSAGIKLGQELGPEERDED
jgi:hypothetical protein